jgi:hypothetical protein
MVAGEPCGLRSGGFEVSSRKKVSMNRHNFLTFLENSLHVRLISAYAFLMQEGEDSARVA